MTFWDTEIYIASNSLFSMDGKADSVRALNTPTDAQKLSIEGGVDNPE